MRRISAPARTPHAASRARSERELGSWSSLVAALRGARRRGARRETQPDPPQRLTGLSCRRRCRPRFPESSLERAKRPERSLWRQDIDARNRGVTHDEESNDARRPGGEPRLGPRPIHAARPDWYDPTLNLLVHHVPGHERARQTEKRGPLGLRFSSRSPAPREPRSHRRLKLSRGTWLSCVGGMSAVARPDPPTGPAVLLARSACYHAAILGRLARVERPPRERKGTA